MVMEESKTQNDNKDTDLLKSTFQYIKKNLTKHDLQVLSESFYAIRNAFHNGSEEAQNTFSMIADQYFMEYLNGKFARFTKEKTSDSQFQINNQSFVYKKIDGKSGIGITQSDLKAPIMMLNLKSEQWLETKPESSDDETNKEIGYTRNVTQGIYVIDPQECQRLADEASGDIKDHNLYILLQKSKEREMYLELPQATGVKRFTASKGIQWK